MTHHQHLTKRIQLESFLKRMRRRARERLEESERVSQEEERGREIRGNSFERPKRMKLIENWEWWTLETYLFDRGTCNGFVDLHREGRKEKGKIENGWVEGVRLIESGDWLTPTLSNHKEGESCGMKMIKLDY